MFRTTAILGAVAACLTPLPAQNPATPPDLQRLADKVDHTHRPDGKGKQVDGFTAALSIEQVAADAKERMQGELKVRFLEWKKPAVDRTLALLRVQLIGGSHPTVRGRDRSGYWLLVNGIAQDLQGRDGGDDYEAVVRDTRIARQLVRLLDPGAVLRAMEKPTPVGEETLQLGRQEPIPCEVVTGTLERFPTRSSAGEDRRVQVKVFVARANSRVCAIEVWPLDADGKPEPGQGEMVQLEDQRLTDGVLLPLQLVHFAIDADGKRRVQMKVRIADIHLNPTLGPEDFDRPKG